MNENLADYALLNTLTPKELQVFDMLGEWDLTDKEIAAKMGISPCTFRLHKEHIRMKIGRLGRCGIVKMAIRTGRTTA